MGLYPVKTVLQSHLPRQLKLVLLSVLGHAEDGVAKVTSKAIAVETEYDEADVRRYLRQLVSRGWLRTNEQGGRGRGAANVYAVAVPAGEQEAGYTPLNVIQNVTYSSPALHGAATPKKGDAVTYLPPAKSDTKRDTKPAEGGAGGANGQGDTKEVIQNVTYSSPALHGAAMPKKGDGVTYLPPAKSDTKPAQVIQNTAPETRTAAGKTPPSTAGGTPLNEGEPLEVIREIVPLDQERPLSDLSRTRVDAHAARDEVAAVNWLHDRYLEFHDAYPANRPFSRKEVWSLWEAVCTDPSSFDAIMFGLEAWKASKAWTEDEGKYVCGAARFLTEERWKRPPLPARPRHMNENRAAAQRVSAAHAARRRPPAGSSIFDAEFHIKEG